MPITHKETRTGVLATTTTPDVTNIASPAIGDLLIAGIVTNTPHTVLTAPGGDWVPIAENLTDGAADSSMSLYCKIAGGSEPATYTDFLTLNATEIVVPFISAWEGVDPTTPLDVSPLTGSSASGTAKDTDAITPVTPLAMLVAFMGGDPGGAQSITWDGGIDERLDYDGGGGGNYWVAIASKVWGGSGAESLGGDLAVADTATEVIVALRPLTSGDQVLAPLSDSVDGSWTDQAAGTALAAAIDEVIASDSDYIMSESDPTNSGCRVKLASGTDPSSSTGHVVHWRIRKDTALGATLNMTVQLYQGGGNVLGAGTLIASFDRTNVDGSGWTTYDEILSGAQADSITDYADLYLEFYATLA